MRIGVLSIQGSFILHIHTLRRLGVGALEIRRPDQLENLDGLILPGGESTTFATLFDKYDLGAAIRQQVLDGLPVWGTCAGAIMLGHGLERPQPRLNLIDIEVIRNAYGRQVDSFVAPLKIKGFREEFPGIFIRAPRFQNPGPSVQVLAELDGEPVMAKSRNVLISSFHPELSPDTRVHRFFLECFCLKTRDNRGARAGHPIAR